MGIHDVHHYKMLPPVDYMRIKEWVLPDPTANASAPGGIISQIQDILSKCFGTECPVCSANGQKDSACVHVTCRNGHAYCYYCDRPRRAHQGLEPCLGNSLPNGCPQYLTGKRLANGFSFSNDGIVATQQLAVLKAKRLLRELYDSDPDALEAVLDENPELLTDILAHDGRDDSGRRAHAPLPGVTITLADILAYQSGGYMPSAGRWKMP